MTRLILLAALVGCGGVEVTATPDQGTTETTEVAPVVPATPEVAKDTDVTVTPGVVDPTVPVTTPAVTTPVTGETTTETTGSLQPQESQSQTLTGVDCLTDIQVVECQSTDPTVTATPAVEVAVEAPLVDTQPVEVVDTEASPASATAESSTEDTQVEVGVDDSMFSMTEILFGLAALVTLTVTGFVLRRKPKA